MPDIQIFGNISLAATPTDGSDLVTKGYVDALVGGGMKSITTIPNSVIAPTESGQVFYKSVTSNTSFTFDKTNIDCGAGEPYEFYVIISTTNSAVIFSTGWVWGGGTAPSTTGGGLFIFRIFTLDSGRTWLAEQKRYCSLV